MHDLTLFLGAESGVASLKLRDAKMKRDVRPYLSSGSALYWSFLPVVNSFVVSRLRHELGRYDAVITSYPSANMMASGLNSRVLYYCTTTSTSPSIQSS